MSALDHVMRRWNRLGALTSLDVGILIDAIDKRDKRIAELEAGRESDLAARLYVALVEERNLNAQRYGEFQTAPITPDDVAFQLAKARAIGGAS